jgi:hypothetical protein
MVTVYAVPGVIENPTAVLKPPAPPPMYKPPAPPPATTK